MDKNTIPRKVEKMHFQTVFKWLLRKNNFWDNSPSPAQEARLMTPGISYGWGFSQLCRKRGQAVRGWVAWYRIKETVSRQTLSVRSPCRPGVLTSGKDPWEAAAPKHRCMPATPGFSSSSQFLPQGGEGRAMKYECQLHCISCIKFSWLVVAASTLCWDFWGPTLAQ